MLFHDFCQLLDDFLSVCNLLHQTLTFVLGCIEDSPSVLLPCVPTMDDWVEDFVFLFEVHDYSEMISSKYTSVCTSDSSYSSSLMRAWSCMMTRSDSVVVS